MKSSYFKILFILIVLAGGLAAGYGLFLYYKPVADVSLQQADFRLSDEQLLKEFETDSKSAEEKYKNKILEITGLVAKVDCDSANCKVIFDRKGNFIIVNSCKPEFKAVAEDLKPNQTVTLKGAFTGFVIIDDLFMIPGEIKMDQCRIVN